MFFKEPGLKTEKALKYLDKGWKTIHPSVYVSNYDSHHWSTQHHSPTENSREGGVYPQYAF